VKGTVFSCPDYAALLEAVRKTKENPVCVMFPQDSPALNFIETVRRQGLRVPEDVSVCGFDGYGSGAQSQSLLTTVRVNQFGLGVAAVDALLEEMPNPGGVFPWKRVKTELAEGQTVLKIKERAKL
jgi:DNA-binding LacI/PurR family transcriptional regulator